MKIKLKNFRPYPEEEDYEELEEFILDEHYEEEEYQDLENEIVEDSSNELGIDWKKYAEEIQPAPIRVNCPPWCSWCGCFHYPSCTPCNPYVDLYEPKEPKWELIPNIPITIGTTEATLDNAYMTGHTIKTGDGTMTTTATTGYWEVEE